MAHAFFDLEQADRLPLWAIVLMASRAVRRAVVASASTCSPGDVEAWLAGCDAVDGAASAGACGPTGRALDAAADRGRDAADGLDRALYYAVDAARAAEASLDFEAAEKACINSARHAMDLAGQAPQFTPIQARICLAGDLDLLRFACEEARIGRYDALGEQVFGRLTPIRV